VIVTASWGNFTRKPAKTGAVCARAAYLGLLAVLQYTSSPPYDMPPYFLAALFGYASHLIVDRYLKWNMYNPSNPFISITAFNN